MIWYYSPTTVTVIDSTIADNTAIVQGGGGDVRGAISLTNSTLSGNSAGTIGGGLFFVSTDLTLTDSTVSGNIAGGVGGGIGEISTGSITVDNSTITGNSSNGFGGGIGTVSTLELKNGAIVSGNSAALQGGGVTVFNGTLTVSDSRIENNLAGQSGGGIQSTGDATLNTSVISGNSATLSGGGIYSMGGLLTVTDSTLAMNTAGTVGGGLDVVLGTADVSNSTVSGNVAGQGGGIRTNDVTTTITDSEISGNTAANTGGGLRIVGGTTTLNRAVVSGNSATADDGGGILIRRGTATLTHSTISGNSSAGNGGGIEILNERTTIDNTIISGNSAAGDGGGIDGFVRLTGSQVTGNVAGDRGGGIFSPLITYVPNPTIVTNSTIAGNSTATRGGGIYGSATALLTNVNLTTNVAGAGGGGVWAQGDIDLTGSTVTDNSALGGDGGGIIGGFGEITVSNSTLSGNSAQDDGGAIKSGSGTVTILDSTLSGNSAQDDGGGIYGDGNVIVTNSTLSGNSATARGGGIYGYGGALTLRNATIAFNVSDAGNSGLGNGGGIYVSGVQNNQIENSIIANNRGVGGSASDLRANLSSSMVQNSLIQSTAGIDGTVPMTGVNGNIIGQDPRLAPLANNGGQTQTHGLLAGSPALDAGNNGLLAFGLTTDQAGRPRILDGTVDIGAFEGILTNPNSTDTLPTAPQLLPSPTDLNPLSPLNTLEQLSRETVSRDRVAALLANNQICDAAATLDQYHTQNFAQHFGRFQAEGAIACAEMQQRLAADSALLYVFAQTDKLHLIALTSEGDPSHHEFPLSQATVFAELTQFQHTLTNPVLRRSEQFLSSAQQLYQWIVEPLLTEFEAKGIHNILFGLDDGLRTLPIAALHDGEQFLIEQYQATLIPSLTLTPTHRPQLQDASVLAMGISAFEQLAPLPAVPVELTSIKAQFPAGTSLRNEQATLANFQTQLQSQPTQIVHLATHGQFQPGRATDSYIQFWDEQLDLQQIAQVDWSNAAVELLVLSACQTALGDVAVEYGFAGLAVQAQAGAAVAGLWGANDAATLALMHEFYRQLGRGQPKGEALRQAQLALLRGAVRLEEKQLVGAGKTIPLPSALQELGDRTFWHPYYWAGFTLIGNPF